MARQLGIDIGTSMFFIKVIIYGLMPLFGGIVAAIIWSIIYFIKHYRDGV
jgi:hypothetical protein